MRDRRSSSHRVGTTLACFLLCLTACSEEGTSRGPAPSSSPGAPVAPESPAVSLTDAGLP
jgi:hypothetical protein